MSMDSSGWPLSIACNPDIFNDQLAVTTLHLAYLDRKETPVVLETGRRRPISDDVLPFHRNVRVAGQANSERATTESSTEHLSSITRKSQSEQTKYSQNSHRKSQENRLSQPAKRTCKSTITITSPEAIEDDV